MKIRLSFCDPVTQPIINSKKIKFDFNKRKI